MKIIDTRGQICPMPIIMVKSAINEMGNLREMLVYTDNEIAKNNLLSFFKDNNLSAEFSQVDDYWVISVGNSDVIKSLPKIKKHTSNYVIVAKNDKMGFGNDELGEILIKGFFSAICELENLPSKIIFYNAGVLLTKNSSVVLSSLKKLVEKQVEIYICGACVDFYGIKGDIGVGNITNMMNICEMLSVTDKVIYP